MGMVQVAVYQVINMIAVGNRRMSAVGAMNVVRIVPGAVVFDTPVGIDAGDLNDMLVIVVFVGAVKMPIVEIPHMVAVLDGYMAAVRAVFMIVVFVDFVCHRSASFSGFYG